MRFVHIRARSLIPAPPERVYAILADYREGHPRILPPRNFVGLEVERGGKGEGTVIRFRMRVLGRPRSFRAAVSEPRPGRVLVESDPESGTVTTFGVTPAEGARSSIVTIETVARVSAGVPGLIERLLTPMLLRPIYEEELRRLAAVAGEG